MANRLWLERLKTLLGRFQCLGLDAGIAASSIVAGWGVYCAISRLGG